MTITANITKTQTAQGNGNLQTFYAYADDKEKTWYIAHTKRAPFKGLILLFVLGCRPTSKPIYIPDESCPVVGTVLCTMKKVKLEVMECDWV